MAPHRARAYAVAVGIVGAALVFFLTGVLALRLPLYFPLSRRFAFSGAAPGELSMDYYGRSAASLLAGAVVGVLAYIACLRLRERDPRGRGLGLWTAYALTAVLLCAGLFGYQLYHRSPAPEPLPSWYAPR